jgi:hypothetical protein
MALSSRPFLSLLQIGPAPPCRFDFLIGRFSAFLPITVQQYKPPFYMGKVKHPIGACSQLLDILYAATMGHSQLRAELL